MIPKSSPVLALISLLAAGLLASCASTSQAPSAYDADQHRLHQKAATSYGQGDYQRAGDLWADSIRQAYLRDDLETAARSHYHLALCLWSRPETAGFDANDRITGAWENCVAAKRLQLLVDEDGEVAPWVELMLAQIDAIRSGSSDALLKLTEAYRTNETIPPDYRFQAMLIRAEAGGPNRAEALDLANDLYDDVGSLELRRSYQHIQAADAVGLKQWDTATDHLEEALDLAIRVRAGALDCNAPLRIGSTPRQSRP